MILKNKIEQFTQKCKQHDWLYEYQDSFENPAYNQGEKERKELLKDVKEVPELEVIYDEYCPF